MTHPVYPDREVTANVFSALVDTLPEEGRQEWIARWEDARAVEAARRAYDRQWDDSLLGVTRFGQ